MNSSFERAMNGPARWLVSAVGVGLAFALGRKVATIWRERIEDAQDEVILQIPDTATVRVDAEPEEVYATARRLDYFNQFLFGVDEIELMNPDNVRLRVADGGREYDFELHIISDAPNEFFGLRVEHEGVLYGTCLIRFEPAPHRGTIVTALTKYKVDLPVAAMNVVKPVVAREVQVYLDHLKEHCERSAKISM